MRSPLTARAVVALAQLLTRLNRHGLARAVIEAALKVSPRSVGLLHEQIAHAVRSRDVRAIALAYQRLLAVCPDDEDARTNAITAALLSGQVESARAALRGSSLAGTFRVVTESLMDPERAQRENAYVATLEDVDVDTADWAILDGDKVYNVEAHCRTLLKNGYVQGRATPDRKTLLFEVPPVSRTIEEPCVHLGGDHNYAHWIQRNLLKLALLEGTAYEELPLLVNDDLTQYQRAYLEMLGIPESRLIRVERPALVHCRKLVVPTTLVYSAKLPLGIEWMRRRLAGWIEPGPPRALVFLSRADARVRRLLNEEELLRPLRALGFDVIVPGRLGVAEQIRAISRARIIVGTHGAAFANLVFAHPGAAVIEINSTQKAHMSDFTVLAKAAGLRSQVILSDDYDAGRGDYLPDADFRVDVDAVLEALKKIDASLELPAAAGA
jgi:hypothetical protein